MRDVAAERSQIDQAIEGKTLCTAFAEPAAGLADTEGMAGRGSDGEMRSYTWNQYRECVRAVTLGLRALGIAPKSFGVIMARNRPEYVIADLAVVHLGA